MERAKKWITLHEWINTNTGEELTKSRAERENWVTDKLSVRYKETRIHNLKIITHECSTRQQTLF